ncbi:MAG TPA: hypothetical protein VKU00_33475 [Chthonomonadaceae bacterium]|nr:hypothetical protein [Chthonomonadaceae bacterium]
MSYNDCESDLTLSCAMVTEKMNHPDNLAEAVHQAIKSGDAYLGA